MDKTFGKLIRECREEHQWKQEELAERWGFTRQYVSQIERGTRKLDDLEQVTRLADLLGISDNALARVGKTRLPRERNDLLLSALLQPIEQMVRRSWFVWQENAMNGSLEHFAQGLQQGLEDYQGQFREPALRLLCSVHECLGMGALEHLATKAAVAHFQSMYDIAEELADSDLLCLSMIHQAGMLRRQGRFEFSFRRLSAAERCAGDTPRWLQVLLWKVYAHNFAVYGDAQGFSRSIDRAESIAEQVTANTLPHPFDRIGVLQEKAQGYALLWHPEKALAICQDIDKRCPFRSLREQSACHILKAQAYCSQCELQTGTLHARTGLRIAEVLQSKRYVMRLLQMCDRLRDKPIGKDLQGLRSEILATWNKLSNQQEIYV